MMRHRAKPVHLVVDSLSAHKTTLVKNYVASTEGRLTLPKCSLTYRLMSKVIDSALYGFVTYPFT